MLGTLAVAGAAAAVGAAGALAYQRLTTPREPRLAAVLLLSLWALVALPVAAGIVAFVLVTLPAVLVALAISDTAARSRSEPETIPV